MQRNINHLAGLRVDKYHNLKDSLVPRPGLVLTKPQTTRDYMAMHRAAVLGSGELVGVSGAFGMLVCHD